MFLWRGKSQILGAIVPKYPCVCAWMPVMKSVKCESKPMALDDALRAGGGLLQYDRRSDVVLHLDTITQHHHHHHHHYIIISIHSSAVVPFPFISHQ